MTVGDIRQFPEYTVHPDRVLHRIHKTIHDPPLYFSNSGEGRFDLTSEADAGTFYISLSPLGAFVEVFGRFQYVTQERIDERSLSYLSLTRPLRLADVTRREVLGGFGIAGDLSAGPDYKKPQGWAEKFYSAGFDGVFYVARHDPSFRERSVALFGNVESGRKLFDIDTGPIPEELIEGARYEFGFRVWPSAPLL